MKRDKNNISQEDEQINISGETESDINNDNIDTNSKHNKLINSSRTISSSFFFSSLSSDSDITENEENEIINSRLCFCNNQKNIYLEKIIWCYHICGSHSLIELNLCCKICNKQYIILFHKTWSGKKKQIRKYHYKCKNLKRWIKKPKKQISYPELLKIYDKESDKYNLLFNNCYHFARAIWDKIDK